MFLLRSEKFKGLLYVAPSLFIFNRRWLMVWIIIFTFRFLGLNLWLWKRCAFEKKFNEEPAWNSSTINFQTHPDFAPAKFWRNFCESLISLFERNFFEVTLARLGDQIVLKISLIIWNYCKLDNHSSNISASSERISVIRL